MSDNDTFISDEEEDLCPLCVEEMDIADKNFKPCPCGYQVCQFCYNNIRQNPELNGKCPACRRPYDDECVEYKVISQEEWKMNQMRQAKREREKKQREKERKDAEQASRKHLAGMRVIQKNLVYVVGLNPPVNPEELHHVLRSDQYFGQYGKILKIVINKRTPNPERPTAHGFTPGYGVYVTFAKKEDAQRCIAAVDGSVSDGRILKAAHGTTKYCSSYLRGQPCPNPNCMFLHEPGEEADSYTRQDLSTRQGLKMGEDRVATHGLLPPKDRRDDLQEEVDNATLPVTASWGKGVIGSSSSSTNSSSAHPYTPVLGSPALATAFPTLAESASQVPTTHQIVKKKEKKDSPIGQLAFENDLAIGFSDTLKTLHSVPLLKFTPKTSETCAFHFSHSSASSTTVEALVNMYIYPSKNVPVPVKNHKLQEDVRTETPPPPGLFPNPGEVNTAASAELLNHLMNGRLG